ncbi:hypothetical protein ACHAXT_002896 [Thalassiosira profunda]
MKLLAAAALAGAALQSASAFVSPRGSISDGRPRTSALMAEAATREPFTLTVTLPGRDQLAAQMKFPPVVDGPSEMVEVRYAVPFGLDVEPKNGLATCTKDGAGGEKVGDILRYTSQWTLGLPRGDGVITTAMSFSGGISWQVSMFDVARAGPVGGRGRGAGEQRGVPDKRSGAAFRTAVAGCSGVK